jgi:hypothetical protein
MDVEFRVTSGLHLADTGRSYSPGDVIKLPAGRAEYFEERGFGEVLNKPPPPASRSARPGAPKGRRKVSPKRSGTDCERAKLRLVAEMTYDGRRYPAGAVVEMSRGSATYYRSCGYGTIVGDPHVPWFMKRDGGRDKPSPTPPSARKGPPSGRAETRVLDSGAGERTALD